MQDVKEPYRILAVDDMRVNLAFITKVLAADNYHLETSQNPQELLERLPHLYFDLFILDIDMPEINGIELAKFIRSQPHLKEQPIIFFTAEAPETTIDSAFTAGAQDFLRKDLGEIEFRIRVRNWLLIYELRRQERERAKVTEVFLRLMFHDFAAPLTIIASGIRAGLKSDDPSVRETKLSNAQNAVESINKLIGNLRSFFIATEPGGRGPVEDVVKNLKLAFDSRYQEKGVKLIIQSSAANELIPNIPLQFLVYQILSNFMSNALKYSPANGTVTVTFSRVGPMLGVMVLDEGHGIPDEALFALRGKFVSASRSGTNGEQGSGSGMMIASYFLEKFHGKLDISTNTDPSKGPTGTTVRIFIPLT